MCSHQAVCDGGCGKEVRFTSGTGGEKGRKPEVYSLVPWEAMDEVARVYAYGAEKYDRDNWRRGYPWSWSYDALLRHVSAFWRGEDNDPESGHPHLAHAAFHILALLWWQKFGKGEDDRFPKEEKK